jgi:7-cyano-7-deazaguanine reductase
MSYLNQQSDLGKTVAYDDVYNPDRLFPIPRSINREKIGITADLPFSGFDIWNHYEVSWLNDKGKPVVAVARIIYGCDSVNIIESKSMKLYFNSFNNTKIQNIEILRQMIMRDIQLGIDAQVAVSIELMKQGGEEYIQRGFEGICLDNLDTDCSVYTCDPSFLRVEDNDIDYEILYSDLLKSNCLVTNQPDWGSVKIMYKGRKINREGLLRYIVSFRNSNDFSEQCIERIFMDVMRQCQPEKLTVYGRFTRRGGIDINPMRSTEKMGPDDLNIRLYRQ